MNRHDYPNRKYITVSVGGKTVGEHRYLWEKANGKIPKGMAIHHINGKTKDNRLENLALVTQKQNNQKVDVAGKGWTIDKANKKNPYRARRYMYGKEKPLGDFGTKCGAIMATRMAWVTHK